MNAFDKHQLAIARRTVKMTPAMAKIMGGMTIEEAREIIKRFKAQKKAGK